MEFLFLVMAAILNGGCCYRTNFLSEPPKYHPGLICIIGINRLKEIVGQLSKLFVTLSFSINFRSQIENQVSDYRLLEASSFIFYPSLMHFFFLFKLFAKFRILKTTQVPSRPNLHNRYKSTERNISQKNSEHMLIYSLPYSCI
jgi:hypothetical protein